MTRYLAVLILAASTAATAQQLPAGPGADVLKARCVSCHDADIIMSQKLSLAGWTNSVAKMVRWGATVTPEEREVLQPYLAAHFSPRPAVSHPNTIAAGEATFKRACQTCHDADIVEGQKLSKAGWTNSINKMVRWGAAVPDAEKDALADYLVSRFPAKR